MSYEKFVQVYEKENTLNEEFVEEKYGLIEDMYPNYEGQEKLNLKNNILGDNEQNELKEDKLKSCTPYELSAFYQILINKLMPFGYKLESEEILLKKDEKKQKTYLHRKHKKK